MSTLIHPRLLERLGRFFPSRVTIQEPVVTRNSYGEETVTWQDLAGHVALAGAMAALNPVALGVEELRRPDRTIQVLVRQILLRGWYPAITVGHRAVVDGQAWNILAVEHDSHARLTRLRVEVVQ